MPDRKPQAPICDLNQGLNIFPEAVEEDQGKDELIQGSRVARKVTEGDQGKGIEAISGGVIIMEGPVCVCRC